MKKKLLALLVCVVLGISVFAGCAQPTTEESSAPSEKPSDTVSTEVTENEETPDASSGTTVTDMAGDKVTIEKADKIVSLSPSNTEIVCALGAEGKLIGIDAYSNFPESVSSVEIVGDFNGPDVEKIISLEPDVVLAGNKLQQEAIDQMSALGITVVTAEATTFEDITKSIELIGQVVGAPDEATKVIGTIDDAVKAAQENKPAEEKTVYYAMSYGENGNWTSGPGSFINTMIELAGGKCITNDQPYPWIEYPVEDLVVANPDIVLVDSSMGGSGDIANVQGYQDLDAVKNGTVYDITADVFTRPGPRIAEAIAKLSEILNK